MSFFNRVKTSAAINRKSEELLYTIVAEEMGNGERNGGLWLKALEQASGNEEKRVAEYIKLRIRALKDDVHFMKEILKDAALLEDSKDVTAIPKAEKVINGIKSSPIIKEMYTSKHWSEVEQQEPEGELKNSHEVISKFAKETVSENIDNNSGQGKLDDLPSGIKGWSWGACFFTIPWAIHNRTWIGLWAIVTIFIGIFAIPFNIFLGIKGREWAWQNRKWKNIEHFESVQKKWSIAVAIFWVAIPIVGIIIATLLPNIMTNDGYEKVGSPTLTHDNELVGDPVIESIMTYDEDSLDIHMYDMKRKIDGTQYSPMEYSYIVKDPFFKLACMDGVPTSSVEPILQPINSAYLNNANLKVNMFAFFQEQPTTIGFLIGRAGASGGSSQTLYLFDTESEQNVAIEFNDCQPPLWLNTSLLPPHYASTNNLYIGPRSGRLGLKRRVDHVYKYNEYENTYSRSLAAEEKWFIEQYNKSILSESEFNFLSDLSLQKVLEDKMNGEARLLAMKFMDFIYYSAKIKSRTAALSKINKLHQDLKDEYMFSLKYM